MTCGFLGIGTNDLTQYTLAMIARILCFRRNMTIISLLLTMWNIVVGPICRRMTGFGMRITHGVSENLYGRASIIWANRLLIILIGPAILLCSVSSTWPDCPKTVTICTAVIGTKMKKTLHILPHWTWPGREGEVTPIFVYTNYPSAEVFNQWQESG